jgi:DNA-binding transcriptional ArsR family regulator
MSKPAVTSSVLEDGRVFWWAAVDVAVLRDRELSPWAKVIYAVLCTYADRTRVCFPSVATLCSDAGMSERQARYALKELEKSGYVEKRPQFREDGGQGANLFRIVGHCRGGEGVAEGGCIPRRGGGAHHADRTRTKKELEKEPLPSEAAPSSPPSSEGADVCEDVVVAVPAALREVAEYYTLKTGRAVTLEDIPTLELLDGRHTPARILRAVSDALDRFAAKGRPASELTWLYVWESLRHQRPTRKGGAHGGLPSPEPSPHRAMVDRNFEALAAAWPRQERMAEARREFHALFPEGTDLETCGERWSCVTAWAEHVLGTTDREFVPSLARFLRESVDLKCLPRADPETSVRFVPEDDAG